VRKYTNLDLFCYLTIPGYQVNRMDKERFIHFAEDDSCFILKTY
jgi:hypothetical protein